MEILGLGWVGLKVRDRAEAAKFFGETLGMEQVRASESRDDTVFRMPSGQVLELFGPRSPEHALFESPVVAGIEVDDVAAFRQEMSERGVEFVTEVEGGPKYGRWCYFRGPEGCLFQVFSRGEG